MNDSYLRDMIINEIQTLKKLDDPKIIRMIKMLKSANNIYLVYEFLQGENLKKIIQKRQQFSEKDSFNIFKQICLSFKQLHKEKIIK